MQRLMVYVLFLYAIVLAFNIHFFLTALSVGLAETEFFLLFLVSIIPAVLLVIYYFRERIGFYREGLLRYLIYITFFITAFLTAFLIIPTVYA